MIYDVTLGLVDVKGGVPGVLRAVDVAAAGPKEVLQDAKGQRKLAISIVLKSQMRDKWFVFLLFTK